MDYSNGRQAPLLSKALSIFLAMLLAVNFGSLGDAMIAYADEPDATPAAAESQDPAGESGSAEGETPDADDVAQLAGDDAQADPADSPGADVPAADGEGAPDGAEADLGTQGDDEDPAETPSNPAASIWDVAYDTPGDATPDGGIEIYVDKLDGTTVQLGQAGLKEVAVTASCYKTDDPGYRFDIGLSTASQWLPTAFGVNDVYKDKMAEFTAKYDTLTYTLKCDADGVPRMYDVSGGTAEVVPLSTLDPATGEYDNLSPDGHPQFKAVFHLKQAKPGEAPGTVDTVDSRSAGFTINLYDYNTQADSAAADINSVSDLQFFEAGDASTADSSKESNKVTEAAVAKQGIVEPELAGDGYPSLTEFGDSSLDVLFDTADTAAKDVYSDVNHLFQLDADGYYTYSSDSNYAYYDASQGDGGDFTVYDGTYNQARQTDLALIDSGVPIGFFPMDDYNDLMNVTAVDPDAGDEGLGVQEETPHHGLGMSVDTSFYLSANGKVDGEPLTFAYTGDDDAWLFIDDVLVLDAGGIHSKLNAEVNFATGGVSVGNASAIEAAGRTIGRGSTLAEIFEAAGKTWSQEGTHTLKFYSLERDGDQSDLTLKTNLWKVTDVEKTDVDVMKKWVDADGNETDPAADSVTVQLYRTVDGKTEKVDGQTVTLSADNNWKDSFKGLPVFESSDDGSKNRITYSVKEETADGSFATYEVGGKTQQTKVYWVRYDASDGVEPGIYAVQSYDYSDSADGQPILLTSSGQENTEVSYTDAFFENGPVTDADGNTYDQYLSPVADNEIWTFSKTDPQHYATRSYSPDGGYAQQDGYLVVRDSSNGPLAYGDTEEPALYEQDADGNYVKIPGTAEYFSGGNYFTWEPLPIIGPDMEYETENGYDVYYTTDNGTWEFYYVKDGEVYEKTGANSYAKTSKVALDDLYPYPVLQEEDGYVVLQKWNPQTSSYDIYYTDKAYSVVYQKNDDGSYTKVTDGVDDQYWGIPTWQTEDGYVVLLTTDEDVKYYGNLTDPVLYRKTAAGEYVSLSNPSYFYPIPAYVEEDSADYDWQISNQGLFLTLKGPGQMWQNYTYVTSTKTQQGTSAGGASAIDLNNDDNYNYRNVFRLDNFTYGQRPGMDEPDGDSYTYDEAGLRLYSYQGLWQWTGFETGYEKNLAVNTMYGTKESYNLPEAGSFWLYRPVYQDVPLNLTDGDWTVVNRPAGDLSVSKTVEGDGASEDDEFTLTISLKGDEDLVSQVNGTFGDIEFVGGKAVVTLKGGEVKTAKNLPAGLTYTVEETVLPGYELTAKSGDTGVIPERDAAAASFTNTATETPDYDEPDMPDNPSDEPTVTVVNKTSKTYNTYKTYKTYAKSHAATSPRTGDERDMLPVAGIALAAGAVLAIAFWQMRRRRADDLGGAGSGTSTE